MSGCVGICVHVYVCVSDFLYLRSPSWPEMALSPPAPKQPVWENWHQKQMRWKKITMVWCSQIRWRAMNKKVNDLKNDWSQAPPRDCNQHLFKCLWSISSCNIHFPAHTAWRLRAYSGFKCRFCQIQPLTSWAVSDKSPYGGACISSCEKRGVLCASCSSYNGQGK